jgi:hypothetical protein
MQATLLKLTDEQTAAIAEVLDAGAPRLLIPMRRIKARLGLDLDGVLDLIDAIQASPRFGVYRPADRSAKYFDDRCYVFYKASPFAGKEIKIIEPRLPKVRTGPAAGAEFLLKTKYRFVARGSWKRPYARKLASAGEGDAGDDGVNIDDGVYVDALDRAPESLDDFGRTDPIFADTSGCGLIFLGMGRPNYWRPEYEFRNFHHDDLPQSRERSHRCDCKVCGGLKFVGPEFCMGCARFGPEALEYDVARRGRYDPSLLAASDDEIDRYKRSNVERYKRQVITKTIALFSQMLLRKRRNASRPPQNCGVINDRSV